MSMFPNPGAPSYPLNDKTMTTSKKKTKSTTRPAKKAAVRPKNKTAPPTKKTARSPKKTAPPEKVADPRKKISPASKKVARSAKISRPAAASVKISRTSASEKSTQPTAVTAETDRTSAPTKTSIPLTKTNRTSPPAKTSREKFSILRPSGQKDDSFFDLVHEVARQIPPGRVTSYGAIAACLGTRLSARMVGWAMLSAHTAPNPVPAHRVVNRNGLLSGRHHYNPPERMQQLLEKEGVGIKDDQVVDFKKLFWDPATEL